MKGKDKDFEVKNEELAANGEDLGMDSADLAVRNEELVAENANLAAKVTELVGDLQRTRADFENYRKQIEAQKENERKTTRLATIYQILPVLDDMDRAFAAYNELKPLEKTFLKTLKELKLSKIESGEGTEFNPDVHEAVMAEGDGEKEVVAETLRPGYLYDGEVLRPAMVKVNRI